MKLFQIILITTFTLLTLTSCSQEKSVVNPIDSAVKRIDTLFKEFDNPNSPGYAIGISKSGKTLYKKGYGAANLDYNIPIKSNSAFSIASVSKQFSGMAMVLLEQQGKA